MVAQALQGEQRNAAAPKYPPHVRLLDAEAELFAWINREDLIGPYLMVKRDCIDKPFCWTRPETWAGERTRHVATIKRRLLQLVEAGVITTRDTWRGKEWHLAIPEAVALYGAYQDDAGARESRRSARRTRGAARPPIETSKGNLVEERQQQPAHPPVVVPSADLERPTEEGHAVGGLLQGGVPPTPTAGGSSEGLRGDAGIGPLPSALAARLQAVGLRLSPAELKRHTPPALEKALRCLEAERANNDVPLPLRYFRAALKHDWDPPASFAQAHQRRQQAQGPQLSDEARSDRIAALREQIAQLQAQLAEPRDNAALEKAVEERLVGEDLFRSLGAKPRRSEDERTECRPRFREAIRAGWALEDNRVRLQLAELQRGLAKLEQPITVAAATD